MNGPFKVGEICIGQNLIFAPEYNEMECEIIGPLQLRRLVGVKTRVKYVAAAYRVRWPDGFVSAQTPDQLRRKPPKQDLTEWANAKIAQLTKPVEQPVKECA